MELCVGIGLYLISAIIIIASITYFADSYSDTDKFLIYISGLFWPITCSMAICAGVFYLVSKLEFVADYLDVVQLIRDYKYSRAIKIKERNEEVRVAKAQAKQALKGMWDDEAPAAIEAVRPGVTIAANQPGTLMWARDAGGAAGRGNMQPMPGPPPDWMRL